MTEDRHDEMTTTAECIDAALERARVLGDGAAEDHFAALRRHLPTTSAAHERYRANARRYMDRNR